jgi:hypothetical protein
MINLTTPPVDIEISSLRATVRAVFRQLPATDSIALKCAYDRAEDAGHDKLSLQLAAMLSALAAVIVDLTADGLPEWPESTQARKALLDSLGAPAVFGLWAAYNETLELPEGK